MVNSTFARWFILVIGGIIAGESLALMVGMHWLSGSQNSWISLKNDILLILDLLTGLSIAILTILDLQTDWEPVAMIELVMINLLTHSYREWEYLAGISNSFCANLFIFILNNIKLLGLLVLVIIIIPPMIADIRKIWHISLKP